MASPACAGRTFVYTAALDAALSCACASRSPSVTHPEFPAEHVDFALGLFFSESPLYQILPVLPGKGHVSFGHGGIRGASQNVGLCLVVRI